MPDPIPTPTPNPTPSPSPDPAPAAAATPTPAPTPTPTPATVTPSPETPAEVVYALTLPKESALDLTAVERATALAKGATLAPDAAQKVVEFADGEVKAALTKQHEKQQADYDAKKTAWKSAVETDPELGGANLPRTALRSKLVMDRFMAANPEVGKQLLTDLEVTGFGNYKPLVAFFNYYGSLMESDPGIRPSGSPGGSEKSLAERLYPDLPRTAPV